MKKNSLLLVLFLSVISTGELLAADAVLPLRVFYIGNRAAEFELLLKAHFAKVESVSIPRDFIKAEQVKDFDVVLLDWPQSHAMRGAWLDGSPLGKREEWNKPTVLLGSAGLNLAVCWKLHGGSGCTCLAPVAYDLRRHEIFNSPMTVDINATTDIPMPEQFAKELKTNSIIAVLPLVNNIRNYHTVIHDYPAGWSSHYYEFADMPDVEVFSGGINEQTPRSAAFWRQGNLLHFGFEQSPQQMNAAGQSMLVNAVAYISRFTEDRPIDVTLSVFGPDKYAVSRKRAKGYFASYARGLTNVFTAAALASFDWRNPTNALAWFETERPWIHPNEKNFLEVDAEAKSLGVIFDSPDFFTKTIAALHDEKNQATAATLLARYAPDGPGAAANATLWEKWWRDNSTYLFYSEMGGYRWYVDSQAKKRGIPSKDLRGSLRADKR